MARRADRRAYRLPVPTSCLFPSRRRNLGLRRGSLGATHAARAPGRTPRPSGGGTGRPGPTAPTRATQAAAGPSAGRPPQAAAVDTRAPRARRRLRQRNPPLPTGPLHPGSAAAAAQSSLVLALGGGYLTDAGRTQTVRVLNLVEHACHAGVPVALVGQGLGPLDDPGLQARAAQVLPKVGLIALREGRQGPQILDRAGVAAERVLVTGDDAIELAYHARIDEIGSDIGFCLRVAGYAPVSAGVADLVGRAVRSAAAERTAALVPLIIAEYRSQDRRSTLPLVRGCADVIAPLPRYVHPIEIARRVARCRVVVTGAYHLAVFALSQGIPVVALTSSAYYDDKFLGLSAMFGQGLTLVRLDDPCLESDAGHGDRPGVANCPGRAGAAARPGADADRRQPGRVRSRRHLDPGTRDSPDRVDPRPPPDRGRSRVATDRRLVGHGGEGQDRAAGGHSARWRDDG